MFNKTKEIFKEFIKSLGIITFLYLPLNFFFPDIFEFKYMYLMFILTLCCSSIFKKGVSPRSLWIRRSIVIVITCIISLIFNIYYQLFNYENILLYVVTYSIGLTALSLIAYIIADKVEKKNIQKINEKLNKMNT
ncbi:MAG: hypothetical protein K0S55_1525 [Clostridia bacterium]|nr:hypothetical protein [Clostridia bacterium]